jgi:hypothetical protein
MRPCKVEREMLEEQTRHRAGELGHTLAAVVKVEGRAVFHARCVHCGMLAGFNLDPAPGELDIYGAAVENSCPQRDDGAAQPTGDQEDEA